MPNTGKPSKDCHLCRSRRVKCDLGRPACQRCIKYGTECPGYRDQHELVFRNSDPSNLKKRKKKARQDQSPQSSQPSQPSPASSSQVSTPDPGTPSIFFDDVDTNLIVAGPGGLSLLKPFYEQKILIPPSLHQHWTAHSVPILLNIYSTIDFLQIIDNQNYVDGPLTWAAHLFTRTYVTNLRHSAAMYNESVTETNEELGKYLGKTLSAVSQALKEPDGVHRDDVLAAVWILANYELLIGSLKSNDTTSPWHQHIRGLYSILKSRGSHSLYTQSGRSAFWMAFTLVQVQCLLLNLACPPESDEWLRIILATQQPWEGLAVRVYQFINTVCHVQHRIFTILFALDTAAASNEYTHLVGTLTTAEGELQAYMQFAENAEDIDTYILNMYASSIVKGFNSLLLLTNYLTHQASCPISVETLKEQRIACFRKIRKSAQDILDFLPAAFNPSKFRKDSSPKALFDALKLIWPLSAVHIIPSTLAGQSEQAHKALMLIGEEIGIRQALNRYRKLLPLPDEARRPLFIVNDERITDIE